MTRDAYNKLHKIRYFSINLKGNEHRMWSYIQTPCWVMVGKCKANIDYTLDRTTLISLQSLLTPH
jgi:hypothetical protein